MTATLAKTAVATLAGGFHGLAVLGSDLYALSGNTLYKLVGSSFVSVASAAGSLTTPGPLIPFGSTLMVFDRVAGVNTVYKWDLGTSLAALTAPASITPYAGLEFGGVFYIIAIQGANNRMYQCAADGTITLAWNLSASEVAGNPLVSFAGKLYHINQDGSIWLQSAGATQVTSALSFYSGGTSPYGPLTITIGGVLYFINSSGSIGSRVASWNGVAGAATSLFGLGAIPIPTAVADYNGSHYLFPKSGNIRLWDGASTATDTGCPPPGSATNIMAAVLGSRTFCVDAAGTTLYELAPVAAAQPGMFIPITVPGMS